MNWRRKNDMGRYYYRSYTPSKPRNVKNGIKLKTQRGDVGEHWWSQRWIRFLKSFRMGARLSRGKTYARKGQVTALDISEGIVEAEVQGSRRQPYGVTIQLTHFTEQIWGEI